MTDKNVVARCETHGIVNCPTCHPQTVKPVPNDVLAKALKLARENENTSDSLHD